MGNTRTTHEIVSNVDIYKMKGFTPDMRHNTTKPEEDKGAAGIISIKNHATGKEFIIGSTNLPQLLYHYRLGITKNNHWFDVLNQTFILDMRNTRFEDFELEELMTYDTTKQGSVKGVIQRKVSELVKEREAYYNLAEELRRSNTEQTEQDTLLNSRQKGQSNKSETKPDMNSQREDISTIDYAKLEAIDFNSDEFIEITDKSVIINVSENLEGGLSTVYKGTKLFDLGCNVYVVDNCFVDLKDINGNKKSYPLSQFIEFIKNHIFISCGAFKTIQKKSKDAKLVKHIESLLKDGFSIEDLENKLNEFKGDNNVKK